MSIRYAYYPPRVRKTPRRVRRLRLLIWLLALPYLCCVLYVVINPPSMFMLASILQGQGATREWVRLEQISPRLINAVIAAEDGAFCDHPGVDVEALSRALRAARYGHKPLRGASTISMQTVKNLFLWQNPAFLRKPLEYPLSLWADAWWGKRRMLEIYLNIAEWGEGIFGIEAAAKHYFGVPARALSSAQAALLATTLPSPTKRNPTFPSPAHKEVANILAARIARQGAASRCVRQGHLTGVEESGTRSVAFSTAE